MVGSTITESVSFKTKRQMELIISNITCFTIFLFAYCPLYIILLAGKQFLTSRDKTSNKVTPTSLAILSIVIITVALFFLVDCLLRVYIVRLVSNLDFVSIQRDFSNLCGDCNSPKGLEFCNSTSWVIDSTVCQIKYF